MTTIGTRYRVRAFVRPSDDELLPWPPAVADPPVGAEDVVVDGVVVFTVVTGTFTCRLLPFRFVPAENSMPSS